MAVVWMEVAGGGIRRVFGGRGGSSNVIAIAGRVPSRRVEWNLTSQPKATIHISSKFSVRSRACIIRGEVHDITELRLQRSDSDSAAADVDLASTCRKQKGMVWGR